MSVFMYLCMSGDKSAIANFFVTDCTSILSYFAISKKQLAEES